MLLASSDRADLNSEVHWFLHLKPKIIKGPFVYRRGDAATYRQFLRCGTEESGAVGIIKHFIKLMLITYSSLEKSMRL